MYLPRIVKANLQDQVAEKRTFCPATPYNLEDDELLVRPDSGN